jgi:hypothetical protein
MFFEASPPQANASKKETQIYNFRSQTATKMESLVDALKNIGAPVKRDAVAIKGGC